jgi:hypothetical protein
MAHILEMQGLSVVSPDSWCISNYSLIITTQLHD